MALSGETWLPTTVDARYEVSSVGRIRNECGDRKRAKAAEVGHW